VRLRPSRLAWYSAWSAACSSACSDAARGPTPATPAEKVTGSAQAAQLGGRQRPAQAVHAPGGQCRAGAGQQQRELFTADAEQRVAGAQPLAQQRGHVTQHRVAHRVAMGVVHALEVVQVQQHQRQRAAVGRGGARLLCMAFFQRAPVQQAGQRVVQGLLAQLGLQGGGFGQLQVARGQAAHRGGVCLVALGHVVQLHQRADGVAPFTQLAPLHLVPGRWVLQLQQFPG
jgi:hypothetical protein